MSVIATRTVSISPLPTRSRSCCTVSLPVLVATVSPGVLLVCGQSIDARLRRDVNVSVPLTAARRARNLVAIPSGMPVDHWSHDEPEDLARRLPAGGQGVPGA